MTKITGKFYNDANFVNVCTDNTFIRSHEIQAIGVAVKSETKPGSVCSTAKHIRQS